MESLCKLLTLGVEAVDNLLEDWYPSIGTRFVHTSEGKYLVTRLCPCPSCFPLEADASHQNPSFRFSHSKSPRMSSDSGVGQSPGNTLSEGDSEFAPGMLRLRTGLAFETPKFGGFGQPAGLNFFYDRIIRVLAQRLEIITPGRLSTAFFRLRYQRKEVWSAQSTGKFHCRR